MNGKKIVITIILIDHVERSTRFPLNTQFDIKYIMLLYCSIYSFFLYRKTRIIKYNL